MSTRYRALREEAKVRYSFGGHLLPSVIAVGGLVRTRRCASVSGESQSSVHPEHQYLLDFSTGCKSSNLHCLASRTLIAKIISAECTRLWTLSSIRAGAL